MKKLLINKETKDVIGWIEAESFDDWSGSSEIIDCDDIETITTNLPGHYLADDGTIQFDESRIVKYDANALPSTAEVLNTA